MKILASDFDLTLYVNDLEIVKKNVEARVLNTYKI